MTTNIENPYKDVPAVQRQRVHAMISTQDYNELFLNMFPRHGFQNVVIAVMLSKFLAACKVAKVKSFYTATNETDAAQLLSSLTFTTTLTPDANSITDNGPEVDRLELDLNRAS